VAHTCNPRSLEAEIRRITVQSQPRKIVRESLSQKNPSPKRAGGVVQGISPELKPQFQKTNKQTNKKTQNPNPCSVQLLDLIWAIVLLSTFSDVDYSYIKSGLNFK
jgi:hypothetical protein